MPRICFILIILWTSFGAGAAGATETAGEPSVAFEKTGKVKQCLRREMINGFAPLSERRFLFDTADGFYVNEPAHDCDGAMRENATFTFSTEGSMICRNDRIIVWTKLRKGLITSCALRDFQELAPVSASASQ